MNTCMCFNAAAWDGLKIKWWDSHAGQAVFASSQPPSGRFFTTQLSPLLTSNNLMYKLELIRSTRGVEMFPVRCTRNWTKTPSHLDSRENFDSNVSVQWPDEASSPTLLWTCRRVKVLLRFEILTDPCCHWLGGFFFFFLHEREHFVPEKHLALIICIMDDCRPSLRSVTSPWQVKNLSVTSVGLWFETEIQSSATLLWNIPLAVLQLGVGGSAPWLLQY